MVVRANEEAALVGLKGARRSGCTLVGRFLLQSNVVAAVELEERADLSVGYSYQSVYTLETCIMHKIIHHNYNADHYNSVPKQQIQLSGIFSESRARD